MRAFTALIGLLLAAPGLAATPAEVGKRVEGFYKERPDLRARFVQEVKKPGRRRVLKKQGAVFFKRPGMMRWDYSAPERVLYVSDGKILWSYQPEDALVTKLNITSSELYHQSRYLFGQGDLTTDFDLAEGAGAPEGTYALKLVPKRTSRNFKSLTLFVDPPTGEIRATELVDPYDNVSRITFTKVQYKALPAKDFNFTPPPNAKIRDLSNKGRPVDAGGPKGGTGAPGK